MNFKDVKLKKAYSSDTDDILHDFYIPILEASTEYRRIAGFFTSTSLAISAKGILGLIKNGGNLKLIVSPCLSKEDLDVIIHSQESPEKYIEKKMLYELDSSKLESEFVRNHVYALGWMLANNKLEIKVAIGYDNNGTLLDYEELQQNGIFHQKVGILTDSEGNMVTFSGSINETASGWINNIEEFKVFRSWEQSERDYVEADFSKFQRYWLNQAQRVKTMQVPEAVKNRLITLAPRNIDDIDLKKIYSRPSKKTFELYDRQKEAVDSWLKNNMRGLFEMATGTGKTITALGCLEKAYEKHPKLLTVITCPYHHLLQQWRKEIDKFGLKYDYLLVVDSTCHDWRNKLKETLIELSLDCYTRLIVLTTHDTFASNDFKKIMLESCDGTFQTLLIADEVHGLGAEKRREGLLEVYNLRLGLSATPKRWFDSKGTDIIYNFFEEIVYKFSLEEAISEINPATGETYLTPYYYFPKFVSLNPEELEGYIEETISIISRYNRISDEETRDKTLELLIFKRANIVKNATEKYRILENILDEIGPSIKWTIVYSSPQQIEKVMKIINNRSIFVHRFTMEEGVRPDTDFEFLSERDYLLQEFANGKYQVLVAMKCLDEGVDIPPARVAVLMASSGNPREYIQRIGRLIRRYPGKSNSSIYDIVVVPSFNNLPKEMREIEWRIFEKELARYKEISRIAINNAEALNLISRLENRLLEVKNE